jgi:thiol-disulfide isomerase/thioredoxin
MSIVKELDDLPAQEVESAADAVLAAAEKERGTRGHVPPITIQVAELYVQRGLRLDRVPALIERGLEEAERVSRDEREWEWTSPGEVYRPGAGLREAQWRAWPVLAEALLKTRQAERARATLDRMSTALGEEKPGEGSSNGEKLAHASREAAWWEWSGRLAEDEGRRLDALICYQNALAVRPPRGARGRREPDRLDEGARRLWKELDGTDAGWLAFQNRLETAARAREATMASTWETKVQPLPAFDLPDTSGRVWRLADLKGKVSLINVWATWCSPCRDELPHLQKLHESLKGRPGVQVLTFNVDHEPGKVLPFLEKHEFTFPVIPASDYVWNVVPMGGIPRNWVVGPDGAMQAEQIGFEADGEAWIRECLRMIERAAAPQAQVR